VFIISVKLIAYEADILATLMWLAKPDRLVNSHDIQQEV
jgi:hypothetical protein